MATPEMGTPMLTDSMVPVAVTVPVVAPMMPAAVVAATKASVTGRLAPVAAMAAVVPTSVVMLARGLAPAVRPVQTPS